MGTHRSGARLWCLAAFLVVVRADLAFAQQRLLTIDDIYDPAARVNFSGTPPGDLVWIDTARYAHARPGGGDGGGVTWMAIDAVTGAERPIFDTGRMEAALARLPGVAADDARRASRSRGLVFNRAYTAALVAIDSDLYAYAFDADRAVRLTVAAGVEELPSFSPDGTQVGFVRGNNLFSVDVATARESRLTTDGAERVFNGILDWVYEEEIYGRGDKRAYWWSPDSSHIAFLRLDDTGVPSYVTVDDIPYDQTIERWDWPKAGDPNPVATLGVVGAAGGPVAWVDLSAYPPADRLITAVGWTPDSRRIAYHVMNRIQTWLDLNLADRADAATPRTLFRETSKASIDPGDYRPPVWLKDGSFLWLSDTSGWRHLFRYSPEGALVKQVTRGGWEVRTLHGVDENAGWVYFSGTERSPIGSDVYRVRLDGGGFARLSSSAGSHSARFNTAFTHYLDSWSDVTTPTQVRLHGSDGREARVIDDNKVAALADFNLSKPEFVQVRSRDGFVMEAMIIRPPDFNPARQYPVYQLTYGGPHSQQVRNAWRGAEGMYHQLLAQKGIIVWICDNRTASGKGAESVWPVYRNFGELELRDLEDCLGWLTRQPGVDPSRVGIHGWSFGGYLTTYALTHSTSFSMGIAGGTVSDWRDYDTVYTERYMGTPQDNPDGYRRSSTRFAAKDLHGSLLLIHGAIDDNVHVANTMQLVYELQKAQKPFRLMLYPKSRHGVTDPSLVKHLRTTMLSFIFEHLKP